jgi:triphosphatase
MVVETELKLRVSPEQLARLKRHALLKVYSVTRPVTRRLYNIYYDTANLDLHKSGMALRLRHVGRQWLQTLKGGGSVQAGLHQRNEWEVPVNGPELDFSATEDVAWDEYLPQLIRKKMQPVFVTDFSRTSRMLIFEGAQIELCMDQGEISTRQISKPICELELELKFGELHQLFELALAILEVVPFELEMVSKAEYGYRLLSGFAVHRDKDAVSHNLRGQLVDWRDSMRKFNK